MTTPRQDPVKVSEELIEFLEDLHATSNDFPESVRGLWNKAVASFKDPDTDAAKTQCKRIETVLNRLRSADRDLRQIDKAQSQTAILLGLRHLREDKCSDAIYYFEEGVQNSRLWGYWSLASLAFLGKAVSYRCNKNWSSAVEAAQKAFDAIRNVPVPERSAITQRLEERVRREINAITDDPASIDTTASSTEDILPTRSASRIPIVEDFSKDTGSKNGMTDDLSDYILIDEDYRNGAHFAVKMADDPIKKFAIEPGDILLFRQQPDVEKGEVAAVIIRTPSQTTTAIKQYYREEDRTEANHWFLTSGYPNGPHIVVIPSTAKVEEVENIYAKAVTSRRLSTYPKYYENGQVIVVGKYVGLVRKCDVHKEVAHG